VAQDVASPPWSRVNPNCVTPKWRTRHVCGSADLDKPHALSGSIAGLNVVSHFWGKSFGDKVITIKIHGQTNFESKKNGPPFDTAHVYHSFPSHQSGVCFSASASGCGRKWQ